MKQKSPTNQKADATVEAADHPALFGRPEKKTVKIPGGTMRQWEIKFFKGGKKSFVIAKYKCRATTREGAARYFETMLNRRLFTLEYEISELD